MRYRLLALALSSAFLGVRAQQTEQFSVATLNVDGLPQKFLFFNVNPDGPGSEGSARIAEYLKQKGYDLVFMQEDFNYHSDLSGKLENDYQFGTWSGELDPSGEGVDFLHLQNHRYDCDGLMGCWKNGVHVDESKRTAWNENFGKFSHCLDEIVTKGFRRYEVTLSSGSHVVVYNLHMDAEDHLDTRDGKGAPDRAARKSQWKQLYDDILENIDDRPIVIVGDMNSLYARDEVKANFIDAINASGKGTAGDVWVELENNGKYPESLEVEGEAIDKIIYINPTDGSKITPLRYSLDREGYAYEGKSLGDHYPVSATFEVEENRKQGVETVLRDVKDSSSTEIYDLSGAQTKKPVSGIYIERRGKESRKQIVK